MSEEELDIEMESRDPTGEVKKGKVQINRRVSIDADFLRNIDVKKGDVIYTICGNDTIHITGDKNRAIELMSEINGD